MGILKYRYPFHFFNLFILGDKMKKLSVQRQPIAHEVVFPSNVERNLNTCVKFVTQSYLYFKELSANDFAQVLNKSHSFVYREFTVSTCSNITINEQMLQAFCDHFNIDIKQVYHIANQLLQSHYNVLIVNEDLSIAKFLYGYKVSFVKAA